MRINAKEFERDFYTTLYENMVLLCAIWVSCGKPNPEIRADSCSEHGGEHIAYDSFMCGKVLHTQKPVQADAGIYTTCMA